MSGDSPTFGEALPWVVELPSTLTAVDAFLCLAHLPHVVFFDSASRQGELGRWSFVAADPFCWIEQPAPGEAPLAELATLAATYSQPAVAGFPPFTGGLAGLFGYGLARCFERVAEPWCDDLPTPALAVGAYDVVLAFDHDLQRALLISQGWPAREVGERTARAKQRGSVFLEHLGKPGRDCPSPAGSRPVAERVPLADLAPQHRVGAVNVTSNLDESGYLQMVQRGIDYIHAGDVFQVNLAQRLLAPQSDPATALYLRLRQRNPAPYAGYLDLGDAQICSASPECFLTVRGDAVETRPIKGTRGRSRNPVADLYAGDELRASEKDRAENVMIADLLRNDLSRVCRPESVHVAQLCELETYAFVKHLVSVVRGRLTDGLGPLDVLAAAFPGGSITGAPKVRAMEVIAELEPTARGAYCGSLAYIGFDGQMDSNILIRTITAARGWLQLPVGGGIVAASDPHDEYRETWHKARGLLEALT
ncbi:MAG: anthranilate synthase component I family protein [Planctomycetales bacterium]|nr:anthranilate synthase component I family protein [Planctomycetales bacterium]